MSMFNRKTNAPKKKKKKVMQLLVEITSSDQTDSVNVAVYSCKQRQACPLNCAWARLQYREDITGKGMAYQRMSKKIVQFQPEPGIEIPVTAVSNPRAVLRGVVGREG